ncbi:MAG: NAD(P)/FAD-dependent oxidoreductase [Lachnospiraceae bacterium]|nr:NAD(P)/FAD-dependent oxidoreductase [Lachnospiraceae bacterium]
MNQQKNKRPQSGHLFLPDSSTIDRRSRVVVYCEVNVSRKIIIVGAGIAGLTAAIYAKRSGFDVTLIEQHSIVGGMCTSWKRGGYLFEGAVHWLTGSNPKMQLHQIWKDTGALSEKVPVFYDDPFISIEHDGQIINLYRDFEKTAAHFITISPEDEKRIRQFAKDVRKLSKVEMPNIDIKGVKAENPRRMSLGFVLKMLPALPVMKRLNNIPVKEFAGQFAHPGLRRLFLGLVPEGYSASSMAFTFATLHLGDGGYPEGGSLAMVHRMAKKFTDLGGELLLNTKVKKVIIENNKAAGIELEDKIIKAGAVIVTQETIAALGQLFDVPLNEPWLNELKQAKPVTCTFIGLGIQAELPETPAWMLEKPITYAGQEINELGFYNYSGYKTYAPAGGTTLTTAFLGDTYDFWLKAKEDGCYETEKKALADQIIQAVEDKFPHVKGKIAVIDVATPLTYERYTGAYHGAWMSMVGPGEKMKQNTGEVKSVAGLYFAGHRMFLPGGLPAAAASGRTAAQLICRQFDMIFR